MSGRSGSLQPSDEDSMAMRDREWPGYTEWYCCPSCTRLWTNQGKDIVALDPKFALGPATPTEGVPLQTCKVCHEKEAISVAEI